MNSSIQAEGPQAQSLSYLKSLTRAHGPLVFEAKGPWDQRPIVYIYFQQWAHGPTAPRHSSQSPMAQMGPGHKRALGSNSSCSQMALAAPKCGLGPNGPTSPGPTWALVPNSLWSQTGPGPKRALGPNRPWAQMVPGPKQALGPNGPWDQMGPGPRWALGPSGPWPQMGPRPKVYPSWPWAQICKAKLASRLDWTQHLGSRTTEKLGLGKAAPNILIFFGFLDFLYGGSPSTAPPDTQFRPWGRTAQQEPFAGQSRESFKFLPVQASENHGQPQVWWRGGQPRISDTCETRRLSISARVGHQSWNCRREPSVLALTLSAWDP